MSERHYRQVRVARAQHIGATLKGILGYLFKHKWKSLLALLCTVLASSTTIVSAYFFTPMINNYIVPLIGQENPDLSGLVRMVLIMAAVYATGTAASYAQARLMSIVSTGVLHDLREDLFDKMQDMSLSFYDTHTHGELMNYYSNDIDAIRPFLADGVPAAITTVISLTGSIVMMLILSPRLSAVVFAMLLVILLFSIMAGKISGKYFAMTMKSISDINGYVEEAYAGQKEIKVFCHEKQAREEFAEINDRSFRASARANVCAQILFPINANLSYVSFALVAVVGARMCIGGSLSLGVLASFLLYTRQVSGPVSNLSQQFNGMMMSIAGAERVFAVIASESEVDEGQVDIVPVEEETSDGGTMPEGAAAAADGAGPADEAGGPVDLVPVAEDNGTLRETSRRTGRFAWKDPETGTLTPLRGDIRFDHVTFSYEAGHPVLQDISLYARPGQKIALVGSTGAGKTTITNLINRFYDVDSGTITYDGIPIRKIRKSALRYSLGVVLQETALFSGTVMDNIRYGRLDATDEECVAAAKLANADSFITRLPDGYRTVLSANGSDLSQGQRQLLNIARAAVSSPPVLILDEATSSVDTHTERLIEQGMDELMAGRTVFVIAHRLSTIRNANAIIVLEHGRIIERGDHEQLLEQKGRYYQLYTGTLELE